jgi:hypothetical protein
MDIRENNSLIFQTSQKELSQQDTLPGPKQNKLKKENSKTGLESCLL